MNSLPIYDEQDLLRRTGGGDELAFEELYEQYRDKIYYFACKLLGSDARAEDVLQEIFLKVWVHRDSLHEINNFKAWLITITRNHIYTALRRQAMEEDYKQELTQKEPAGSESSAMDNLMLADLRHALDKALTNLTPQQKQVFELSRLQGLNHQEIADQLGISRNTVRKHITDALRVIRNNMGSQGKLVQIGILLFLTLPPL